MLARRHCITHQTRKTNIADAFHFFDATGDKECVRALVQLGNCVTRSLPGPACTHSTINKTSMTIALTQMNHCVEWFGDLPLNFTEIETIVDKVRTQLADTRSPHLLTRAQIAFWHRRRGSYSRSAWEGAVPVRYKHKCTWRVRTRLGREWSQCDTNTNARGG